MTTAYVTSRAGTTQWVMQRVSAALLIFLAFLHFGIQHFTSDAVTTGLTVSARANNPWWQAYYVIFVILALYHGVNGVVGIVRDYQPKPLVRGILETLLWTLAAVFAVMGSRNFLSPTPLAVVKEYYAANGFSVGDSAGHPPVPGRSKHYDFRQELRELHLLAHYLEKHTARTDRATLSEIFYRQADTAGDGGSLSADDIVAAGEAFDAWCQDRIQEGPPTAEHRDRSRIFSSSAEFAVWAVSVRIANAKARLAEGDPKGQWVLDRFARPRTPIPAYRATDLH